MWHRILQHSKQKTTLALKGSGTNKTRKQCEGYGPCQELNKKRIWLRSIMGYSWSLKCYQIGRQQSLSTSCKYNLEENTSDPFSFQWFHTTSQKKSRLKSNFKSTRREEQILLASICLKKYSWSSLICGIQIREMYWFRAVLEIYRQILIVWDVMLLLLMQILHYCSLLPEKQLAIP